MMLTLGRNKTSTPIFHWYTLLEKMVAICTTNNRNMSTQMSVEHSYRLAFPRFHTCSTIISRSIALHQIALPCIKCNAEASYCISSYRRCGRYYIDNGVVFCGYNKNFRRRQGTPGLECLHHIFIPQSLRGQNVSNVKGRSKEIAGIYRHGVCCCHV